MACLLERPAPLLLSWTLFAGAVAQAVNLQHSASQEARLCLARVAPLPKAEGYGALCTSIESLYQQQQSAASSFVAMKEEGERMHASYATLQRSNQELEAQVEELQQHKIHREKELEAQVEELQQHKINREKEWQAAAKKFQAGVASRDAQWQATVSRIEEAAEKKVQLAVAGRDAHWQASIRRLESEKRLAEQQASELQKQKEAMEASTSMGTDSRRSILLALNREKTKIDAGNKEVRGLMDQIRALQRENAQLVQRCVVGN